MTFSNGVVHIPPFSLLFHIFSLYFFIISSLYFLFLFFPISFLYFSSFLLVPIYPSLGLDYAPSISCFLVLLFLFFFFFLRRLPCSTRV